MYESIKSLRQREYNNKKFFKFNTWDSCANLGAAGVVVVSKVWMLLPKSRRAYRPSHACDFRNETMNEVLDNEKGDRCACAHAWARPHACRAVLSWVSSANRYQILLKLLKATPAPLHTSPGAPRHFIFFISRKEKCAWSVRKLGSGDLRFRKQTKRRSSVHIKVKWSEDASTIFVFWVSPDSSQMFISASVLHAKMIVTGRVHSSYTQPERRRTQAMPYLASQLLQVRLSLSCPPGRQVPCPYYVHHRPCQQKEIDGAPGSGSGGGAHLRTLTHCCGNKKKKKLRTLLLLLSFVIHHTMLNNSASKEAQFPFCFISTSHFPCAVNKI